MQLNADFSKQVEVWVDNFDNINQYNDNLKIFVAIEPNEIMGLNNQISSLANKFDYIFTYDEQLLEKLPNAELFEYGTKWIELDKYDYSKEKEFSVSTICGHKMMTKNHIMRKKIWYNQNKITVPKKFFMSQYGGVDNIDNNPVLGDRKEPLFDSMFHICIENVNKKYFFTEKLIDCFVCKSIPIYYGCETISNYFDTNGFFTFNSLDELYDICNKLTVEDYYKRKEYIEKNYTLAMGWIDFNQRLIDRISTKIN